MINNITGVILAGGDSKRFGSPKAFATKDKIPFYQYSMQTIEPLVTTTFIVTNPKLEILFARESINMNIINDYEKYRGHGPLAGIYTVMDQVSTEWYMVIPIDVPFVERWIFEWLVGFIDQKIDAIVPLVNGKKQPLLSLYHCSMKKQIKEQLDLGKRSVHRLLDDQKVKYVPIEEEKPFMNINWQKDYYQYVH